MRWVPRRAGMRDQSGRRLQKARVRPPIATCTMDPARTLPLLAILVFTAATDAKFLRIPNSSVSFSLALCLPAYRDELPVPYRRICAALEAGPQPELARFISDTAQQLEDNDPEMTPEMSGPEVAGASEVIRAGGGHKRQDMEHVFFRFGRRE